MGSKGIKLIKKGKKKEIATKQILNFNFTSNLKVVFSLYYLRANTFIDAKIH